MRKVRPLKFQKRTNHEPFINITYANYWLKFTNQYIKISASIMQKLFGLKRNRYNLCGNYLLKLPDTSTCQYGTQALCFKGSLLLWNKVPNKYKDLNSFEEFKNQIKQWHPFTCSCKICEQANFIIFFKGLLLDFADGVGCN